MRSQDARLAGVVPAVANKSVIVVIQSGTVSVTNDRQWRDYETATRTSRWPSQSISRTAKAGYVEFGSKLSQASGTIVCLEARRVAELTTRFAFFGNNYPGIQPALWTQKS